MAHRSHYWSCTPFADWIRGTKKLDAATSRGWREWEEQSKRLHPIRHWIAEEALDAVQNFLNWPLDRLYDVKYYINNRYITGTHSLTANPRDIKPGEWRDLGNRFLPCLFNELVNFVEVELAWSHLAWNHEERAKYNMPWWAVGWWRIRSWRCPQAGLDNLAWQSDLVWTEDEVGKDHDLVGKPTHQAEKAREILALYKWWTQVYRNRPDPHDAGGWTAYCNKSRGHGLSFLDFESRTPEDQAECDTALNHTRKIEEAYRQEDEEMLIRLIKIRDSLWS